MFVVFLVTLLLALPNLSSAQSPSDSTWSISTVLLDKNQDDTLDYIGERVKIGGIANSSLGQLHTTRLMAFIQSNKHGIPLYTKKMEASFGVGDSLVVQGELQNYNGSNEIYVDSYKVFPEAGRTLTAKPFSKVGNQPKRYVGMLVTGSGTITQKGTINNGIYLSVAMDKMPNFEPKIFVSNFHDSFNEFNFDILSIGDEISVTGILSEIVTNKHHYLIHLRTPNELQYSDIPKYYFYIGSVVILFILIGIVAWIVSLRKTVTRKTKKVEQSLKEKDMLLREIHHRVKNNLSIISGLLGFQLDTTEVENTQNALQDSQSRIQSMALIHDKLYQTDTLTDIQLNEYLQELVETISSTFVTNGNIDLVFDLDPVRVDVDTVVPCGLLVNELVVNAFKHAFPESDSKGTLSVMLEDQKRKAKLTVADDGPGLPDDFELGGGDSLGSMLIETFAAQLEAEITLDKEHSGAAFIFIFPKN